MELADVKIYRMTHIRNIPHILLYGITHRSSPNANPNYVPIGDTSLINTRSTRNVVVNNGNISTADTRRTIIALGDFNPFYFGIKMPMLYVIQAGGNFVEKAIPQEDIIYITCKIVDIISSGILFYFSDGHATDNFTSFYDQSQITNLLNIIDWNAIKAPYWGGTENLDLKRKKQAEFLIGSDVAPQCLLYFGCCNITARDNLISIGIDERKIKIVPNAYY
jgi:hypothetical protein